MNQCINMIFPNEIYLKENKRLKTQEDKTKLENIYDDIFYSSLTIPEMIKNTISKQLIRFYQRIT